MDALTVTLLVVVATVLLLTERMRADLVALLVLAALILLRLVTPEQALSGLSSPATVTVACMFVISGGLQASGLVELCGLAN